MLGQCALDPQTFLPCSGPADWTGDCQKTHQSPINIITTEAKENPDLKPFTFSGYNQKKKWIVKNDGHSGGSCVCWVESPGRVNCAGVVSRSGMEVGGATREASREGTPASYVFSHFIRTVGVRGGTIPGRRDPAFAKAQRRETAWVFGWGAVHGSSCVWKEAMEGS